MRDIYEEVAKDDTRKVSIEIRLFPMGEEDSQQEFKQSVLSLAEEERCI